MPSSVRHTWDIPSQIWYAEQLLAGRQLHPMADNDDPHQLGGDVVVTSDRKLSMIYRSKFPLDRPSVNELISNAKSNL